MIDDIIGADASSNDRIKVKNTASKESIWLLSSALQKAYNCFYGFS
jgi:hypothetical protein